MDSVCKEVSKDNASVAKESILVPDSVNEEVLHIEKTYNKVGGDSMKISDPENVSKKSYASVVSIVREDPPLNLISSYYNLDHIASGVIC